MPPPDEGIGGGSETGVEARLVFAESDFLEEDDDEPPWRGRPSGPRVAPLPPLPPGPFPSLLLPDLDPEAPLPPFFFPSFTLAWNEDLSPIVL